MSGYSVAVVSRWTRVIPLCLGAAVMLTACGTSGGSLDTSDLTKVEMSSAQALPPPYGSAQAVLSSAGSLATFQQELASHHIGVTSQATSGDGCTGGIQYTIVLDRSGGKPATTLSAYDCGGQITGNVTGDVSGFLSYVSSLLVATPSGQG